MHQPLSLALLLKHHQRTYMFWATMDNNIPISIWRRHITIDSTYSMFRFLFLVQSSQRRGMPAQLSSDLLFFIWTPCNMNHAPIWTYKLSCIGRNAQQRIAEI